MIHWLKKKAKRKLTSELEEIVFVMLCDLKDTQLTNFKRRNATYTTCHNEKNIGVADMFAIFLSPIKQ